MTPYERGKGESTVACLKYVQAQHPNQKLILLWARARYHCGHEVQAYLNTLNHGLEEKDWKVTCLLFAPNAAAQNPVEDMWLQGKNFLRRHCYDNTTFQQVTPGFLEFLNKKVFNFEKSKWYLEITHSV